VVERVCTWGKCVYISKCTSTGLSLPRATLGVLLTCGSGGRGALSYYGVRKSAGDMDCSVVGGESGENGEIVCIQLVVHWTLLTLFQVPWSSGLFWLCCRAVIVLPRLSGTGGQTPKDMEIPALVRTFKNCCL